MPDIWGWICIQYGIKSVLDIGCGSGSNLVWFEEYGFDILGVEGHPNALKENKIPGNIVCHDFTTGSWSPNHKYDLCLCTEFAEHVEAIYEENWMLAVDKCRYLLLAPAPPGQGGYNHVNEQPNEYWIERFEIRGFQYLKRISTKLRDSCDRKPSLYCRNNILFFVKK